MTGPVRSGFQKADESGDWARGKGEGIEYYGGTKRCDSPSVSPGKPKVTPGKITASGGKKA